jgi:GNAT superfamily N-acetyltransferase
VWSGESADERHVAAAIADVNHRTHIAVVDTRVIGFVDGFRTVAANGQPRWEVDLLAVHPDYHGQKIGQQLIAATTQHARQQGHSLARALVQIDNVPSQRAFQRCGYHRDGIIYTLMVTDAAIVTSATPNNARLIPVNTMNYRGLWLEGDLSRDALAVAQAEVARHDYDIAGALVPSDDQDSLDAATASGYRLVSHFQWWRHQL